ncbi:MAG TPA: calcium-binding protein, partial [Aliiroseovarius sp.]|nr:calcium-binding protein [Aliiroseovarius sp.]
MLGAFLILSATPFFVCNFQRAPFAMTTNIQFSSLTLPFDLATTGTATFLAETGFSPTSYSWTTLAGHSFTATGTILVAPRTGSVTPRLSKVDSLALNLDGDSFAEIEVTFDDRISLAPLIGAESVFWATVLAGRTVIDGGFSAAVTFAGDLPTLAAGEFFIGGRDVLDFSDALQGVTLSGDVLTLEGTLVGGKDQIIGSAYDDMIYGERQTVSGGTSVRGRDLIEGGGGDDQILGQTGGDTLLGGAGSDTIKGGKGNDFIDGGADHDILFGNLGNDTFLVSEGLDEIDGGDGTDALDFSNVLAGIADTAATFSFYDMSQPPGVFDPVISWGDPVEKLEDVTNVEKFIFGDFGGALTVHGNSDDEIFVTRDSVTSSRLVGMAGNDTFRGGALLG